MAVPFISKADTERYITATGLQKIATDAVNHTILSQAADPVSGMVRALEAMKCEDGIRHIAVRFLPSVKRGVVMEVVVSSGLSSQSGRVSLPPPVSAPAQHVALQAHVSAWLSSASDRLVGFNPMEQQRVDDILLCMRHGLAHVRHVSTDAQAAGEEVPRETDSKREEGVWQAGPAITQLLTLACSTAVVKLGARHASLPTPVYIQALIRGLAPTAAALSRYRREVPTSGTRSAGSLVVTATGHRPVVPSSSTGSLHPPQSTPRTLALTPVPAAVMTQCLSTLPHMVVPLIVGGRSMPRSWLSTAALGAVLPAPVLPSAVGSSSSSTLACEPIWSPFCTQLNDGPRIKSAVVASFTARGATMPAPSTDYSPDTSTTGSSENVVGVNTGLVQGRAPTLDDALRSVVEALQPPHSSGSALPVVPTGTSTGTGSGSASGSPPSSPTRDATGSVAGIPNSGTGTGSNTHNEGSDFTSLPLSLFLNLSAQHLFIASEVLARERADAEASAAIAAASTGTAVKAARKVGSAKGPAAGSASPAAKPASKDKKDAAGAVPVVPAASWAADPSGVSTGGESEEGASWYDVNANKTLAVASGWVLEAGAALAAPAPAPTTGGKAKAATLLAPDVATPDPEAAVQARQLVSHVRLWYWLQELLATYATLTTPRAAALGPTTTPLMQPPALVVDMYGDTDEVGWTFLASRRGSAGAVGSSTSSSSSSGSSRGATSRSGVTHATSRFTRLYSSRLLDAAVAAVASGDESTFRHSAPADALHKERNIAASADAGLVSLDTAPTITAAFLSCRAFVSCGKGVVWGASSAADASENIDAHFIAATNALAVISGAEHKSIALCNHLFTQRETDAL